MSVPGIRILDFLKSQRDEMISQFASKAGQQAATQFKPDTERIIRSPSWPPGLA